MPAPRRCGLFAVRPPRPFPAHGAVRLVAAFLLMGIGGQPARGDIQNPPGRNPRGLNVRPAGARNDPVATAASRPASAAGVANVEVTLGGSVDIPLRAFGQLGKSIDFLLREPPAHGSLGPLRPTGRDSAVVTYTHRAEAGPAADSFSYAVQAPGTAVSAPVVVEVRVLDDPPRPAIVGEDDGGGGGTATGEGTGGTDLDFGDVPAGSGSARRELWVENRGGGVAVGTLEPPPPWVVEGTAAYRLGRDERQGFTLVFRPTVARAYTGRVVVGRGAGAVAQLSGAGLRPDGSRPPPPGTAEESATPAVAALIPPPGRGASAAPGAGMNPPRSPGPDATSSSSSPPPPAGSGADTDGGSTPPPPPGRVYAPLLADRRPEESPVKNLVLQERGKHTLTVTWPAPKPAPSGYRVEVRRLWMEHGDLQTEWDLHENVAYTVEPDGTVRATVRGLEANEPQTVRVRAVDGRGTLSAPSAQIVTATLPDPRWWQRITPLKALVAGLAVCLFLIWRRKRIYG